MVSLLSVWCFSAPVLDLHFSAEADYARQIHPRLFPYLYAALHMAITGSDYLNLAAAVERYIALDGPFRDRDPGDFKSAGCLPRTTWFYILGILVGTVAFNLPVAWERTAVEQLANSYDRFGELAVYHTSLRTNQLYVKLYRLTLEFLVFKATPWFAFFILFLSLKDRYSKCANLIADLQIQVLGAFVFNRVHFYQKRRVRKTLSVRQYLEVLDSRIILGINGLFYATNALPLFVGASHVFLYPVAHVVDRAAHLCVVLNSALKLFVYLALSHDFRASVRHLAVGHDGWHWMAREERAREFLGHAKVVTFVQSDTSNNLCADVDNEEELLGR